MADGFGKWRALTVLGAAQFLMVLDSSVMNVSISQLVEDFDTEVSAIQATISLYALVMAALMVTGGKMGDLVGRRRAFAIGLVIYGIGSAITAASPTVPVLMLGWSVLEGVGAALVLPALAALVGGNYQGKDRAVAYAVIGGLSGVGIAVGPILGGWVTTNLTWRVVFVGEVVLVIVILLLVRWLADPEVEGERPQLDGVGAALSAMGLGLIVIGVLQSSSWGWLSDRNSPIAPFGLALTPFVIGAGFAVLALFWWWQDRREAAHRDPLVRRELFAIPELRAGLWTLMFQSLILLGIFFTIPLYLQIVQGFDAFETGVRLLPVSITTLVASMSGATLGRWLNPRQIVRIGLVSILAAALFLLSIMEPDIDEPSFAVAMAVLGIGMGLLLSQLGNVVQSAVGERDRSEVGGLQYTAQNLGSALGTALIGAIALGALTSAFLSNVQDDPAISDQLEAEISTEVVAGVDFVPTGAVETAAEQAGLSPEETDALVTSYADGQLMGLKIAVLAVAVIVGIAFLVSRGLPTTKLGEPAPEPATSARREHL